MAEAKREHTQSKTEIPSEWNEKYTDEDKAKVIELIAWINEGQSHEPGFANQRSQTKLATASGISASAVNTIILGKYVSPPGKHLDKLLDTTRRQLLREKENVGDNPFVETSIFHAVKAACHRAHMYRSFSVVSAYVGTGKTWALKQYAQQHPNCILIEATPDMNSMVLLRELAEKCNAIVQKSHKWSRGTKSDLMDAIVRALKGSDKLLILDEADKVSTQTLEFVRRISDIAKVGVVLCGTEMLQPMIKDPRGRFGQISSRVLFWPPVAKMISANDARKIVEAALENETELTPDIHQAFYEMCDGSARVLARSLVTGVRDYGLRKGHAITPELIIRIGEELLGFKRPTRRVS